MPSSSDLERLFYGAYLGLTDSEIATKNAAELRAAFIANGPLTSSQVEAKHPSNLGLVYNVDPLLASTTAGLGSTTRSAYYRVVSGGTITKLGIDIAVSSGNIALAVYSNSGEGRNAVPVNRVATTGSVVCPVAGFAEIALNTTVEVKSGDWFAVSADNATVTFRAVHGAALNRLTAGRAYYQDNAFPPPASATPITSNGALRAIAIVGVS